MKLKDCVELRNVEERHKLRMSKVAEGYSKQEFEEVSAFQNWVYYMFVYSKEKINSSLFRKLNKNKAFKKLKTEFDIVKSIKGKGTRKAPYEIETTLGNGKFYDAHECFKDKKFPTFIKEENCFSNCYNMIKYVFQNKVECTLLNGIISGAEENALHSVLLLKNNYILDTKVGVFMEKELYLKMFCFEILSEVKSIDIYNKGNLLVENKELLSKYDMYHKCFAFYDLIESIENGKNEEIDTIE